MHSCETMFTNKQRKGSKQNMNSDKDLKFYYFNHYLTTALNTYGEEKHFSKMFKALILREKQPSNTVVWKR